MAAELNLHGLGGDRPVKPGEQTPEDELDKLPLPVGQGPVPAELRQAWTDYMKNGFKQNEKMFKQTLDAFMRPYNYTVRMYVALFVVGVLFFVVAAYLGLSGGQSVAAVAFGGLGVVSFVVFFIRQPVQALEENLEFISWLSVAFNTYWTRLMYMQDQKTIQSDVKAATDDYCAMIERIIDKHAEMRGKRPGAELTEAPAPAPAAAGKENQPAGSKPQTGPSAQSQTGDATA